MKRLWKSISLILGLFLSLENSLISMEKERNSQQQQERHNPPFNMEEALNRFHNTRPPEVNRNWNRTLNVSYNRESIKTSHDGLTMNGWFIDRMNRYINKKNRDTITNGVTRNIATFRFFIYYQSDDSPNFLKYVACDAEKIFLSGHFKYNHDMTNSVISADYFNKDELGKPDLQNQQVNAINTILGDNIVNDGFHSEGSILIYLSQTLPWIMDMILTHENQNPIKIIGTTLQILSLKDPCSPVCIPMFYKLTENFRDILRVGH